MIVAKVQARDIWYPRLTPWWIRLIARREASILWGSRVYIIVYIIAHVTVHVSNKSCTYLREKAASQWVQRYRLSPVCSFKWRSRLRLCLKSLEHQLHRYGIWSPWLCKQYNVTSPYCDDTSNEIPQLHSDRIATAIAFVGLSSRLINHFDNAIYRAKYQKIAIAS